MSPRPLTSPTVLKDPTRSSRIIIGYEKALREVIDEIEAATLEYLRAHSLSVINIEVGNEAVSPGSAGSNMPPIPDRGGILNLDALRKFFSDAADAAINGKSGYIGNSLEQSYTQGVLFGNLHLKSIRISTTLGLNGPDRRVIDALVSRNLSGLKGINEATGTSIISSLSDGLIAGEGIDKLTIRVIDQCNDVGWRRAEALARTETMRAVSHGTLNRYNQAGVKYVKFLAASDDGRRCDTCGSLQGRVYSIEESYGVIPVHPNCRCCWTPIVDLS